MLRRVVKFPNYGRLHAIEHSSQHGFRRLPDDTKDCRGDSKADEGIRERVTHPHTKRAKDNCQAGEPISTRMVAVGDQRRAVNLLSDANAKPRHGLVAQKADNASSGKPAELHDRVGMNDAVDRFISGTNALDKITSTTARPAKSSTL